MSNILRIPLNKIRQEGNYKELLDAIERGFNRFSIDFYLVGATARDVWMRGLHEVTPKTSSMSTLLSNEIHWMCLLSENK